MDERTEWWFHKQLIVFVTFELLALFCSAHVWGINCHWWMKKNDFSCDAENFPQQWKRTQKIWVEKRTKMFVTLEKRIFMAIISGRKIYVFCYELCYNYSQFFFWPPSSAKPSALQYNKWLYEHSLTEGAEKLKWGEKEKVVGTSMKVN